MAETLVQKIAKFGRQPSFSLFVLAVIIFTVVAVIYHPKDPWLHPSHVFTSIFANSKNSAFQIDNSIITTGEDFSPPISTPAAESMTELKINATKQISSCMKASVLNCSDPGVLTAVKNYNTKHFRSILFLKYQIPVNGSRQNECDVAWNFRNRKERSWRKYRDFRRFMFSRGRDCTYSVINFGGWHSGRNARRTVPKTPVSMASTGNNKITSPTISKGKSSMKGNYLYYSRGGDHCKGMNQFLWSLLCAIGEAQYLNRTFVMDLNICITDSNNHITNSGETKDFRNYFDFDHLKETVSIVEEGEFLHGWRHWDKTHTHKISTRKVSSYRVTPAKLRKDKNTILWRRFDATEPENYWYRVCENLPGNYVTRPWQALWKSKELMNIVAEISGRMDWDFDAVHVVRGDKAVDRVKWPHLDDDTSPDTLLLKLKKMVKPYRNVYIATNEPFYNYFDKLRAVYKVHLLEDYRELWGNMSQWYNETRARNRGIPVHFDGYMREVVDTEILYRAKLRVETFSDLSKDCKDGINSC